jgi:N-acetylglucosamine kinase-like BadF-type ATPase
VATVAVDVGQSGSRSLAVDASGTRRGRAGGYWSDAVAPVVLAAVRAVAAPGEHDIGVGLSGYHRAAGERSGIAAALSRAGYRGTVTLADDAVTAHLGAFAGGPGIVVAVGTGAVVLHCDGARSRRVDGLGHELGDRGSGYWIGRAALREAVVEDEEGDAGRESLLLAAARRHLGAGLRRRIAIAPPSVDEIASFARVVADAARQGDLSARRVMTDAGIELARSVAIALRHGGGPAEVCLVGGLSAAGVVLTDALVAGLPAGCRLVEPRGDGVDGALLLTRRAPGPFGELVTSFAIDGAGGAGIRGAT